MPLIIIIVFFFCLFLGSPADIDAGRLEGNPNSVFRTTLQHVMELQKNCNDATAKSMDIPRLIPALITRIKELKGFTELGIFRISVGKDDLDNLRKQIDSDFNYNFTNIRNAHICAAMLKEWLRSLNEPIIPTEPFYAQAIESVKGANNNVAAIGKLFENLPSLNQKILKELALMVREISDPRSVELSKMSVENCAIVFAPCFLRNPSEDVNTLMENTKYETKFTSALFRNIANIQW